MYTGSLVRLREYRKDDIEKALNFVNDSEIKKCLHPGIPYPLTLQDEEAWFEENSASNNCYSFAIETLKEGKYIGGCGFNKVDFKNRTAVVGIFIGDKEYLNRGYGTDAMKILLSFAFDQMNMNKVKLNVFSFNKRAIRSYEKCGFKVEGVLREELYRDGEYHDELIMGILISEYRLAKKVNL